MSHRSWPTGSTALTTVMLLSACDDRQSALSPKGTEAEDVYLLFWIMVVGGTAILAVVLLLTAFAMLGRSESRRWLTRDRAIIGGGVVFPIVVLTLLLAYGLSLMAQRSPPANGTNTIRISVVGERWWWRTIYTDGNGRLIESANELRLPVGQSVRIELTTADVIHSFWVPALAGKLDMIPGRTNVLTVSATEPGVSRGQCAEYCGGAHALMSFYVVAMPPAEFRDWLAHEAAPAAKPKAEMEERGSRVFQAGGCGGCHRIRGTAAAGTVGPDLTHVGSRMSLAAATLPNDAGAFARWIADNQHIKPENLMPPFRIFSESELMALAAYLESLK